MNKENIKRVMGQVKFHAGIVFNGLLKTIYGTLVAGLIAMSVYGFVQTTTESGYTAVCNFVVACATLAVALLNVYAMGSKKRGKK